MAESHAERWRKHIRGDEFPSTPEQAFVPPGEQREIVNQSQIAKRAGVSPQAVFNWRTRALGFPSQIPWIGWPPSFYWDEVKVWIDNRKANTDA
jgi:hypothetical protein